MQTIKSILLGGLILTAPMLAQADIGMGDKIGVTESTIREAVEAAGFTLTEIEPNTEGYEVEVTRNGSETEFTLGPDGRVTALEVEPNPGEGGNNDLDDGRPDADDVNEADDQDGTEDDDDPQDDDSHDTKEDDHDNDDDDDDHDDDDSDDDD